MLRHAVLVMVTLGMTCARLAAQEEIDFDALPDFTTLDERLYITKVEVTSRREHTDDTASKHYFGFDAILKPGDAQQVVAVSRDLKALRVYDFNGNELTPPPERGRAFAQDRPIEDFAAVVGDQAETNLPKLQLIKVPWAMRSLDVEAVLLWAKERSEHELPAAVMEEYTDAGGVELRIERLTMSGDRKLSVSMQYRRSGGTSGPFVEAIYALDEQGHALGGGRWTDGSPLKDKSKLTFEFELDTTQFHKAFRVVICADYEPRPVGFTLTGLCDP